MAYFLMNPVFSWRVSHPRDKATLVLYGAVGLVLIRTSPMRKRSAAGGDDAPVCPAPRETIQDSSNGALACTQAEALSVFPAILDNIISDVPECRRIWIQIGRQPGRQHVSITAHRTWPPPLHRTILIGKSGNCTRMEVSGCAGPISWTWFDNGYARIYQIVLPRAIRSAVPVPRSPR